MEHPPTAWWLLLVASAGQSPERLCAVLALLLGAALVGRTLFCVLRSERHVKRAVVLIDGECVMCSGFVRHPAPALARLLRLWLARPRSVRPHAATSKLQGALCLVTRQVQWTAERDEDDRLQFGEFGLGARSVTSQITTTRAPRAESRCLRAGTLQSEAGQAILRRHSIPQDLGTVVVVHVGLHDEELRAHTKSGAALRVLRLLRTPLRHVARAAPQPPWPRTDGPADPCAHIAAAEIAGRGC